MRASLRSVPVSSATSSHWAILDRTFLEHPRSLGEGYWQHQQRALGFGTQMIAGGIACLVHAAIPALFERTASTTIIRLIERMRATHRVPV